MAGGGQTTTTSAGFLATDDSGELRVRASTAGNPNLADASWQTYTAGSDVALDNTVFTNALTADITTRSFAVSVSALTTFSLGGRTLRTGAFGFGDNAGRNLILGTADADRGELTVPEGVAELYILHRRQNTASASSLILNSVISGAQDVIFGGPNGYFQLGTTHTYTGKTFVNCGILQLNAGAGLPATSEIHLSSGAQIVSTAANLTIGGGSVAQKLSGGGTVPTLSHISAGTRTVTLGANATFAPGNSGANAAFVFGFTTSKLTFAPGARVEIDLGAPGDNDRIAFAGAAGDYLATTGSPDLVLNPGEGFDPAASYKLIENVTTGGFSFAQISGLPPTLSATVTKVGNDYVLTFTPMGGGDPTLYQQWIASHPALAAAPVAEQSPTGNPDGDDFINLAEYAMGLDPMSTTPRTVLQQFVEAHGSGGWKLVISAPYNPQASDVVWEVLRATSLPPRAGRVDGGRGYGGGHLSGGTDPVRPARALTTSPGFPGPAPAPSLIRSGNRAGGSLTSESARKDDGCGRAAHGCRCV